jgi:hypothetical protein
VKSVARKTLSLDVRADGGYVIAPPSQHASGNVYVFKDDLAPLAECPRWVADYANGQFTPPSAPGSVGKTNTGVGEFDDATLRSALAQIPSEDRDTWRDVGAALHSLNWGERGLEIWTDWAKSSPKYDPDDQRSTWQSFDRPYDGQRITVATIFYKARQLGWVSKRSYPEFQTDLGNARRLVLRHGENIRFIHEWHKWIVWDSSRWQVDEDGAIMRLAKETVQALYPEALAVTNEGERKELLKHAIKSQAEARLRAMVSLAESEASVVLSARLLDADPWLLVARVTRTEGTVSSA